MGKRKYPKIYKSSEVSLKQVGKFEMKGMALPYGAPLYTVVNSQGEVIHPKYFNTLKRGCSKERCKEWIKMECWNPEDKPFRRSLLERLMRMDNGQKAKNIKVIENEATYHGERHSEGKVVFEQNGEYYRFGYIDYFGLSLGRWQGQGLHLNDREYLCKRVYPKERIVKITDFVIG